MFVKAIADLIRDRDAPTASAPGSAKKNYTEALSHGISSILAEELRKLGLADSKAPTSGRDKSFMGGYGPKGVDVYLSSDNLPAELHAETYPQRLVDAFNRRNPFY
jgi:hypothetical protein